MHRWHYFTRRQDHRHYHHISPYKVTSSSAHLTPITGYFQRGMSLFNSLEYPIQILIFKPEAINSKFNFLEKQPTSGKIPHAYPNIYYSVMDEHNWTHNILLQFLHKANSFLKWGIIVTKMHQYCHARQYLIINSTCACFFLIWWHMYFSG